MKKAVISKNISVYSFIAESIHTVTDLPTSIWIPDKKRQMIEIVASIGLPVAYVRSASLDLNKTSVVGDAFKKNKIQKIKRIEADPRWTYKKQAKDMNWMSAICVPITTNGFVIGVISVYAYTERSIDGLIHKIPIFAKQVAFALDADRRRDVFQKILNINEKIQLTTKGSKNVLSTIVKEACDFTGADCAVLYPYDPRHDEFYDIKSVATYGLLKKLELKEKPRSTDGMAAYVKRKSQIVLSDIKKQDPNLFKTSPFIKREKIRSFMGIALKVSGKTLGILYVNFRDTHLFNHDEKEAIQLFAHQASIVINNANLYTQLDARARALTGLHKVTPRLVSITSTPKNLNKLLVKIAKDAQSVLGADLVDLYQYHQKMDDFELPPVQTGKRNVQFEITDRVQQDDIIRAVIGRGTQYVLDAQEEKTLTQPFKGKRGGRTSKRFVIREKLQSVASIPLSVGSEVVGILFANYRSRQNFTQQQRELIELFAGQAAIAIYNARLYQQANTQISALEKLHEVGSALTSIPKKSENLKSLLKRIAESAQQVLGAELVDLYQYLQIQKKYDLPPIQIGERHDKFVIKDEIYKDDVIWKIVQGGKPKYTVNAQKSKALTGPFTVKHREGPDKRFVIREGIKSTAAIPLKAGDEILGVLFANYRSPQSFDQQQKRLIELFASQAAIAIWNARSFTGMQQRLGERLNDISVFQQIHEKMYSSNPQELFSLIAEKAAELTNGKYGGLWLTDRSGKQLDLGGLSRNQSPTHNITSIPINNKSINGWIVKTKKPYLCNDSRKDPHYKEWYADTLSELAVPLIYNNNVIGTLNVESTSANNFTDDHVELLKTLANQAAIAIQNSRVIKKLDALDDVGQALTGTMRLREHEILELLYKKASNLMDTDNMYIALYDEWTDIVRFGLAFVNGKRVDINKNKKWQPRKSGKGKTEEIVRTKQYIFHPTKMEAEKWYAQPGRKDYTGSLGGSWLGVPMVVENKVIGVIATYHPSQEYVYSHDDLDILQSMAIQAATAVDNSRMYYDVNQRLNALVTFEQEIASAIYLGEDKILELIHKQASQLMDTSNMYIALFDKSSNMVRFGLAFKNGEKLDWPARKAGKGKTETILNTNKHLFHATYAESKAWYKKPEHKEYVGDISSSWLGVPMIVRGKTIGVIATFHLTKEYLYGRNDLEFLQAMANQAATALDNAWLYQEARSDAIAAKQLATLGTAIAALQHRINNTLNIIIPNTKRLRSRIDMTDPTIKEILDIIERNTRYTSDILLRIQTPLQEVESSSVNLNSLINEITEAAKKEWGKSSSHPAVKITFKLDDSIPLIQLPVGQISEIVRNLIDNAYRAMKKGGKLLITSNMEQNIIFIRLKDTAKGGIPPAIQERLFKKPVPSKEPGHGAGLGLWLSKLMLQGVGGDVIIEKTGPNGTTMLINIPVSASRKEAAI